MRRGLETLGVIMVVAVSWISISRLQAGSVSATAQVTIIIPEQRETAQEPSTGLDLVATMPQAPATATPVRTTMRISRGGRATVLHTQIPQI